MLPRVSSAVPIDSLRAHPGNARKGDIAVLTESLRTHGQYSPIIVNANGVVIAGHNVLKAAKQLGWKQVDVRRVDVDDDTAARMVIADNRTSDLATYNLAALGDILRTLPDLTGTGFEDAEAAALEQGEEPGVPSGGLSLPKGEDPAAQKVRVGQFGFLVDADTHGAWEQSLLDQAGSVNAARKALRSRLGFPEVVRASKEIHDPRATPSPPGSSEPETVPVAELVPYPGNPRQGDVGAIAASLVEFGQYRPLVITPDNVVVKGNNTLAAMKALGWTHAEVVRTTAEPAKVLVVDNRSSDLAGYDDDRLRALVMSVSSYDGTGLDGDDVEDLLRGGPGRPTRIARSTTVDTGQVRFTLPRSTFTAWAAELPEEMELVTIARRLDIPVEACSFGGQ
jgi:ParB-like chromosome segregation protein Spo0J